MFKKYLNNKGKLKSDVYMFIFSIKVHDVWMNGRCVVLHSFQQYCSHVRIKQGDNEKLHAAESYLQIKGFLH